MPPLVIEWRITGACNERCRYCYGPMKSERPDLTTRSRIAAWIVRSGVKSVRITGGEPTLVPELADHIAAFNGAGLSVILSTNGLYLRKVLDHAGAAISKINISLDGATGRDHAMNGRSIRGFSTALNAIRNTRERLPAVPVKVGTVLTGVTATLPNLLDLYDRLEYSGISRWKVYQYMLEGPRADRALCVEDTRFQALAREFRNERLESPFPIVFASASSREGAYFIIQPNGDVVVPVHRDDAFDEVLIGTIDCSEHLLFAAWAGLGDQHNHERHVAAFLSTQLDMIGRK